MTPSNVTKYIMKAAGGFRKGSLPNFAQILIKLSKLINYYFSLNHQKNVFYDFSGIEVN